MGILRSKMLTGMFYTRWRWRCPCAEVRRYEGVWEDWR